MPRNVTFKMSYKPLIINIDLVQDDNFKRKGTELFSLENGSLGV